MGEHRLVVARDLSKTGGEEVGLGALEEAVTEDVESYSDDGRLQACLILAGIVGKHLFEVEDDVLRRVVNGISPEEWASLRTLERISNAAIWANNTHLMRSNPIPRG